MIGSPLNVVHVDLQALESNIGVLRERARPADFMIVVKADAYGHGTVPTARRAYKAGVRNIGTLDIPNALAVRGAVGDDCTVLAWLYMPDEDFRVAIEANIDLSASTLRELERISDAAGSHVPRVQFKIDTGLNRNGSTPELWPGLMCEAARLEKAGRISIAGIWTHIAEASDDEDTISMRRFESAIDVAAEHGVHFPVRHLAASSAAFRRDDVRYDMVRVGGHCWGIPSFNGVTPFHMGLMPVMTLTTTVVAVVTRSDGRRLAELAIGYSDGVPRDATGAVDVAVRGIRLPLSGEVGATSTVIDVTGSAVSRGDTAYLFGNSEHGEQTVREWGDATGTLGDEIVARVSPHVMREYRE